MGRALYEGLVTLEELIAAPQEVRSFPGGATLAKNEIGSILRTASVR